MSSPLLVILDALFEILQCSQEDFCGVYTKTVLFSSVVILCGRDTKHWKNMGMNLLLGNALRIITEKYGRFYVLRLIYIPERRELFLPLCISRVYWCPALLFFFLVVKKQNSFLAFLKSKPTALITKLLIECSWILMLLVYLSMYVKIFRCIYTNTCISVIFFRHEECTTPNQTEKSQKNNFLTELPEAFAKEGLSKHIFKIFLKKTDFPNLRNRFSTAWFGLKWVGWISFFFF